MFALRLLCVTLMIGAFSPCYGIQGSISEVRDQFRLIDQEPELIGVLQKYLESENSRLDVLHKFKNEVIDNIALYKRDDELAWNPLAIYRTVKQLTIDFNSVKETTKRSSYNGTIFAEKNRILPDEDYLYGVINDLIRLKKIQSLTIQELMDGRLTPDSPPTTILQPEDCFYIGKISAEKYDHETAVEWLQACNSTFDNSTRDQAYQILIPSTLFLGDRSLARKILVEYDLKRPDYPPVRNLALILGAESKRWVLRQDEGEWMSHKVCAGDYKDHPTYHGLRCRYNHHNSAFLAIAPLKEEMLSLAPKISVFREAIYDSEIELLKSESYDSLRLARIGKDGKTRYDSVIDLHHRVANSAYLDNHTPQYDALWNRIEDITALYMDNSDRFQIIHYPVGGYVRLHKDFTSWHHISTDRRLQNAGNKMATALLYMSDVAQGGETVFPYLNIKIKPVKGSVGLWVNMKPDRREDTRSRHAACPVTYGEKIVCTEWLRSKYQEYWISEAKDDKEVDRFPTMNPSIMCGECSFKNCTM